MHRATMTILLLLSIVGGSAIAAQTPSPVIIENAAKSDQVSADKADEQASSNEEKQTKQQETPGGRKDAANAKTESTEPVKKACGKEEAMLRLGHVRDITVRQEISDWVQTSQQAGRNPRLTINGRETALAPMDVVWVNDCVVSVNASRKALDDVMWDTIRSAKDKPKLFQRKVTIRFLDDNGSAASRVRAFTGQAATLTLVSHTIALWFGLVWAVIFFLLCYLGIKSETMLKQQISDSNYRWSLAKVQMAFWLIVIVTAFIFVYVLTGEFGGLDDAPSVLAVLGISAGTFLGATAIGPGSAEIVRREIATEATKLATELRVVDEKLAAQPSDAEKVALKAKEETIKEAQKTLQTRQKKLNPPANTDKTGINRFFQDILQGRDGVQLHRLQLVAWTLIFGSIVVVDVLRNLALPELGTTALGLMGISSGTYLGFKFPALQGKDG